MAQKKAKRQKQGGEINRVSGGGKEAWAVEFDRISMFGSAEEEEEEEEERPRLRVSSHKEVALVSSIGDIPKQIGENAPVVG